MAAIEKISSMNQHLTILFALLISALAQNSSCQTVYTGTVGKATVEFVVGNQVVADSQAMHGVYLYKRYNNPIALEGIYKKGTLTFYEPKKHPEFLYSEIINGKDTSRIYPALDDLVFPKFNDTAQVLTGYHFNSEKKTKTEIKLVRQYDLFCKGTSNDKRADRELLQTASGCGVYFRIRVSCNRIVTGVRVLSVGSGKTVQFIDSSDFQVRECHDCDVSPTPPWYYRSQEEIDEVAANYAKTQGTSILCPFKKGIMSITRYYCYHELAPNDPEYPADILPPFSLFHKDNEWLVFKPLVFDCEAMEPFLVDPKSLYNTYRSYNLETDTTGR